MKYKGMKFPIVYKLALSFTLLVLISVSIVGWLFYNKSTELLVKNVLDDIAGEIQEAGYMLQRIVRVQNEDVLFLATTLPVQKILHVKLDKEKKNQVSEDYEYWIARLESIFKSQLRRKKSYLSIRFINKDGQELIHARRHGDTVVSLKDDQLQNKSHRMYVSEALKQPVGSVYVSEINLNREFGMVTEPYQEVLRSATPVYNNKTGSLEGVLAITAEIGDELHIIQNRIRDKSKNEIYITNDQGDYLLHPDASKIYGFDLGKSYRVQDDMPLLSQLFLSDNRDKNMVLMPTDTDGHQVVNFTKISFDSYHIERFIAVVIAQDYASIVSEQSKVMNNVLLWALVLAFVGTGLGVLFSIRLTRPIAQITRVMDDYANDRKSAVTMPVHQNDEIGLLARSYEKMIDQVEAAEVSLKDMNSNLENIVAARTHELELSENRQRSIVENMVDGLITVDDQGVVTSFNPAASKIFGYKSEEIVGKNSKLLIPAFFHSKYDDYIKNIHQVSGQKNIAGDRELEGQRKDKSCFPMELAVSEMIINGKKSYTGLVRDITERKQMEKMKNEFISTVSHELRTPLTSIRGSLGLLSGGAVGELSDQAKEMLKIAGNNTERLLLLINDILDIQKIESGQIAFKFQSLNLMPFLEQVLEDNAAYGEQHGVKFVIAKESIDTRVYADKDRLMQVMANLLSNAAKFSPDNETVEVSIACHQNDSVRISVTDHGPGIPEEFQPKLFERFTQSDSSDSRQKGGTGLGLSITKAIVEKHGGQIGFVSREGIGTTFYVELPEFVGDFQKEDVNLFRQLPIQHAPSVLIIEDDPDIAALIRRMLAEAGYNSDIAYNANEARQQLNRKSAQYKAITLDLVLPGEEGAMGVPSACGIFFGVFSVVFSDKGKAAFRVFPVGAGSSFSR